MDALIIMLRNVLLFVALAIPGYLLVKTKMLKQEQSGALSKLLMYVGMPFLILSGTVSDLKFTKNTMLLLAIVFLIGIVAIFAMFFLTKPLSAMEKEEKTRGMMRFCSAFANNGFIGIPLAEAVFSGHSLHADIMFVLTILNILTNILMYTLGIYLVSGDKSKISLKKAFLNPVLIAFLVGIVLNLVKVADAIPEVIKYSNHFKGLVTPISMTILGMKMGAVKIRSLVTSLKVYYVSLIRLIIFPAFIVLLLFLAAPILPNLGNVALAKEHVDVVKALIIGVFIAFSMPTAGLASAFADSFEGDTKNAVAMTLGTTILSIATIPTLYWLLTLCLDKFIV